MSALKLPPAPNPVSYPMRRPEVERVTGMSCAHIYRMMKAGKFPKGDRISYRTVTWQSHLVFAWVEERRAQILGGAA